MYIGKRHEVESTQRDDMQTETIRSAQQNSGCSECLVESSSVILTQTLSPNQDTLSAMHASRPEANAKESHLAAPAGRSRLNPLSLPDLDRRLAVADRAGSHSLLDLSRHGQESLFDVGGILG